MWFWAFWTGLWKDVELFGALSGRHLRKPWAEFTGPFWWEFGRPACQETCRKWRPGQWGFQGEQWLHWELHKRPFGLHSGKEPRCILLVSWKFGWYWIQNQGTKLLGGEKCQGGVVLRHHDCSVITTVKDSKKVQKNLAVGWGREHEWA